MGPRLRTGMRACAALALAVVLLLPALARADYERWYAVEMGGQRAGWLHNSQKKIGDRITTKNEIKFEFGRAAAKVSISIMASFVETAAGKPVSIESTLKLGATPTIMLAEYGEKEIQVTLTQSGTTTRSTRPLPEGTWLTPAAANEFVRQRLAAGAAEIVVRTVDPGSGLDPSSMLTPVTITHKDCRPATVEAMGKTVNVTRCVTTTSTQPGIESVEFLDEQGVPVRSETTMGGIAFVAVAVERKEATAKHAGPEMMINTFVKPDRKIDGPRETTRATYVVSVPEGKLPVLPSAGSQRFEGVGEREGRLVIDTKRPAPAAEGDATDAGFTAPSQVIDSADEKVKSLVARATEGLGPRNRAKRAEAMRLFVHRYINKKNLGVGFATASETARTREGDCTEHGVLLAALLRADGIPSRVVCGLVYADQFAGASEIFGYHLWTQALLEVDGTPCWVDLDATLSDKPPFDATHLALAASALGDGQSQEPLLAIATIIGRLQIRVESVE